MSIRGQRFVVDLPDDDDDGARVGKEGLAEPGGVDPATLSLVKDIVERGPAVARLPVPPTLRTSATGFPEHKKRNRPSTFKQKRDTAGPSGPEKGPHDPVARSPHTSLPTNISSLTSQDGSFEDVERRKIDEENRQRLAAMSEDEIDQERKELLASLSPSFIESLLKRANLDEGRGDTGIDSEPPRMHGVDLIGDDSAPHLGNRNATIIPQPTAKRVTAARTVQFKDDVEPADPGKLQPTSRYNRAEAATADPAIHFPQAPPAPELDPSDPSFLEALHTKYFPSFPADPSKLAWMAPVPTHGSVADQDSPYYPGQNALPASALRFDFRGGLLPPRIARAVPMTKGLHHHGEAPEAAGYTIPELARLARSAFPAQRCVAYQTLGRFLYRLGRGEWGDDGSEMSMGLWRCVDEGKVIETLQEAASSEGGHQGSKVYAVEAVWLWQKGGGKRWKAA